MVRRMGGKKRSDRKRSQRPRTRGGRKKPKLTPLISAEEQERRKPLPPETLIDALQDYPPKSNVMQQF